MRYLKPLDIWTHGQAVIDGQIKLQRGQWIRLGSNSRTLSRFHSVSPGGAIWATHGEDATRRFLDLCQTMREGDRHRLELQTMHRWARAVML